MLTPYPSQLMMMLDLATCLTTDPTFCFFFIAQQIILRICLPFFLSFIFFGGSCLIIIHDDSLQWLCYYSCGRDSRADII